MGSMRKIENAVRDWVYRRALRITQRLQRAESIRNADRRSKAQRWLMVHFRKADYFVGKDAQYKIIDDADKVSAELYRKCRRDTLLGGFGMQRETDAVRWSIIKGDRLGAMAYRENVWAFGIMMNDGPNFPGTGIIRHRDGVTVAIGLRGLFAFVVTFTVDK